MTIYGRSEELVSRCIECGLAEPESLASLGGSAPGLVDGILSFKFDPAASPPRWNVVRPTASANNQANVLEFDPVAWMTEVPDYQAWMNVINSVPMYSTMGTSPAVASSPVINPCPLVETVEDKEENTVG